MPTWQMRLLTRAALTIGGPSSIFSVSGFSTYTSLPALSASMAIAACQWSGTPISTASTSFISSSLRWSVKALGFGRDLLRGVDLGAVDIADRRHIHGSGFDEFAHVAAAALAAADQSELHALVGAVHTGVGKSSGGSHAAEKCPAWDIVFRHDKIIC